MRDKKTRVIDGITINQSSGSIVTIASLLEGATNPITAAEIRELNAVEIRGHGTSFEFGNSDLSDKSVKAAELPYFRENISYTHLQSTYVRAVADADITAIEIEIHTSDSVLWEDRETFVNVSPIIATLDEVIVGVFGERGATIKATLKNSVGSTEDSDTRVGSGDIVLTPSTAGAKTMEVVGVDADGVAITDVVTVSFTVPTA